MTNKIQNRRALGYFFFLCGFCFSTWASRIPNIKNTFDMNDAELGSFLFILPISSLIGLPLSAWLVSKFDSRYLLFFGFLLFLFALWGIGVSSQIEYLIVAVIFFALGLRAINISMNTQAIQLQKLYTKKINGKFHGYWSLGGLCGLVFATLAIDQNISMAYHLVTVAFISLLIVSVAYFYLLRSDREATGNKLQFGKPDKFILYTGLVVFCAAVCEGGVYDWSSVYFKEVVNAELFTLSYLVFMISMTISRFFTDRIIMKMGMSNLFLISAIVVIFGITILILFPYFYTALLGFFIAGFGVASIFPMAFLLAGQSKKYAPGMAISIVGTYSTIGVLIAPPLIGYLAHIFNLNYAFLFFICSALFLIYFSKKAFYYLAKQ
ncbi:MAG: MFS transporter [Flavobacteriaceae bacterium]